MNAVTRETGGEEHFMEIQQHVIEDEALREHIPDSQLLSFVLGHAPFFRYFATHLPDELASLWSAADTDEEARRKIEEQYDALRTELNRIFEQQFDQETQTALTDAAESGDYETFAKILEIHLARGMRTEE